MDLIALEAESRVLVVPDARCLWSEQRAVKTAAAIDEARATHWDHIRIVRAEDIANDLGVRRMILQVCRQHSSPRH